VPHEESVSAYEDTGPLPRIQEEQHSRAGRRHAHPNSWPFYASLMRALGRTLALVAIVGAAAVFGFRATGQSFPQPSTGGTADPGLEAPQGTEEAGQLDPPASPPPPAPSPAPVPEVEPPPTPVPEVGPPPASPPLGSLTVQVLDGVGDRAGAQAAAAVLEELGYDVVVVNPAVRTYAETTVFYGDGRQADAEALRDRDPRFGVLAPNEGLAAHIDLHVVVGKDWPLPDEDG
jgi:hypothetical protein